MRPQHRKFAAEYIKNGGNGVQAVFAAGYKQGYFAAGVTAYRLLKSAKIKSMIDQVTNEAVAEAKLTEERVKKEIAKVAFAPAPEIDLSAKMKGLDLATKVLGMQTQKVETKDITESHIVEQTILKRAERTGKDPESIALSLLESFQDEPEFLQPEHWGKFAYLLSKPQETKQVM